MQQSLWVKSGLSFQQGVSIAGRIDLAQSLKECIFPLLFSHSFDFSETSKYLLCVKRVILKDLILVRDIAFGRCMIPLNFKTNIF